MHASSSGLLWILWRISSFKQPAVFLECSKGCEILKRNVNLHEIHLSISQPATSQSVSQSISQSVNQPPVNRSVSQSVSQSVNQPANQPVSQSTSQKVILFFSFFFWHVSQGHFITLYSLAPTCFGFTSALVKEYPLIARKSYKDTMLCTSNKQLCLLTNVKYIYL